MKKYIIILLSITAIFANYGCEDFLDKNPLDQLSSESFWETESDAERALMGVYSRVLSFATDHHRLDWDAMSDDFYLFGTYGRVDNIAKGLVEPTTGGIVTSIYVDCYKGISAANIFLDNIDRVEMDASKSDVYKGEVLFIRALFYFTLTEFYGGVPLYTEPVTYQDAAVKQKTKAEVVAQIIADLNESISYLPDVAYNGHAVKGSSLALKAKVLMHNEQWAEAASAANEVIQSKVFTLYDDYPKMFIPGEGQSNNPEILFSAKYLNPDRFNPESPDTKYANAAALNARQDFVDEFECTDGLPIDSSPLYDPDNYKANRDPRLDYSIRTYNEPFIRSDGSEWTNSPGADGKTPYYTDYLIEKYIDANNLPADYETRSDQDYILLRYAQVLLIYAESKNEASGPDQSVYDAVNEVRARVGVDMPPLPSGLDQAEMRDRIRHERRVELGVEGHRYLDLKRWKTAEIIIPTIVDPGGVPRQFDPAKHYLFPFPQSEIDANPNLDQNPKY